MKFSRKKLIGQDIKYENSKFLNILEISKDKNDLILNSKKYKIKFIVDH